MAIPNYQTFMLPVLKEAAKGNVFTADVVDVMAQQFGIAEEERNLKLASGAGLFYTRVSWAITYLVQAGLVQRISRGCFTITTEGTKLLQTNPACIDNKILGQYPSFNAFRGYGVSIPNRENPEVMARDDLNELLPEEVIHQSIDNINLNLANELLRRILATKPIFFENLIGELLKAMGYSNHHEDGWEHTGKSGDDGIDGIINQDVLGVDKIYIQAKRYASQHSVTSGDIRNFIGALDMCRAVKGVFVTTSDFTNNVYNTITKSTKNIVLINGKMLTQLMIQYGVGCKIKETINIQTINEDFFEGV